jgi:hypothetical protein
MQISLGSINGQSASLNTAISLGKNFCTAVSIWWRDRVFGGSHRPYLQQVQKYERGANRVSSSRLVDIANILDVNIPYFSERMSATVQTLLC